MGTYLGQNFLKDTQIIKSIAQNIQSLYEKTGAKVLIEIGPGKGAITKKILNISEHFFVIEKDETMKPGLEALLEKQQIIMGDVLEQDINKLLGNLNEENCIVVGNLPYYITSPIFKHLFRKKDPELLGGFFMIQDEVGEKIKTDAKKKSYLRWLINRGYIVEYVKPVPAKCFSPAPKVKSCLIKCIKKSQCESVGFGELEQFLNLFAPYSRKTIGKIEKMIEKKGLGKYAIPEPLQKKRLEECSRKDLELIIKKPVH